MKSALCSDLKSTQNVESFMLIQRTYKFRLKPTPQQEQQLVFLAGCRRFVWNWALRTFGEDFRYPKAARALTAFKQTEEGAFLKEAVAQTLQQVLQDLERAFVNQRQGRSRWPRFKSRKSTPHALRFPQDVRIENGAIFLPKLGAIAATLHRLVEGQIKSATVKQTPRGRWNITLVAHSEIEVKPYTQDTPVGIDVGLESFLTLSSGEKIAPPRFYRKQEAKLRKVQRRVSRKHKGSKNRTKARRRLAAVYERVGNQRENFLHQLTHRLVERHDVICIEDLNLSALTRTKLRGHAKSWTDAALGEFRRQLEYKALWRSRQLVLVSRFYPSSQLCCDCGFREPHALSVRRWICPCCQTEHDRDVCAARNILTEGLRQLTVGTTAAMPVEEIVRPLDAGACSEEAGKVPARAGSPQL